MNTNDLVLVLSTLGIGAVLREVTVALLQRRKLGADAVAVISAAAADLVEPLRKELAAERAEHTRELDEERQKVRELRADLDGAREEVRGLRAELQLARVDADALREGRLADARRIRELEAQLRR